MNLKQIGIGLVAIIFLIGGIFHLMDWSYKTGKEEVKNSCENSVNNAISNTKNQVVLEYQIKLEKALEAKQIEYKNWDYAKTECIESNVVELCDCGNSIIEDYENMISERDDEIQRLNSLLLNYQYK